VSLGDLIRPFRPTTVAAAWSNRKLNKRRPDPNVVHAEWRRAFDGFDNEERSRAEATLAAAYESASSRQLGLEAKGMGVI
jgi:hypothetical protein